MTASPELQQAIDSLKIRDVYLRELDARCLGDFDPKYAADLDKLLVQQMHLVRQSQIVELDGEARLLRIFVRLGARWVDAKEPDEASSIRALVESEFIAEYEMDGALEEDAINEFSLQNASYHIWPYWRELLSSQCVRMNLPKVMLPMVQLAHNRHQEESGKAESSDETAGQ